MSKFGARLEPMSHVQLQLVHGRTDLDIVGQAESIETLAPMVADLDHMTNGIAMLEAVDQLALEREPAPHLYRMLVGALRTVARRSGPLVVPAFYWKLLAAEGITPLLDECARCGEPGPLVAFDMDHGGALCRNCRSGTPLGEEALEILRLVLGGGLNEALSLPTSSATHEVAAHATRAMEHHIERRLRTVAMFERMET
jgi:DNA repair protein RecO (recombination protein O)